MPENSNTSKTALVVEGGGMRGIFAAGVLDAFLSLDFDPFDLYVGVSAGAGNIASYLAGQYERSFRVYTKLMTRPRFICFRNFVRGGHWMDLDYLWDTIDKEDPLDVPSIFRRPKRDFTAVGTCADTGTALYIRPTAANCSNVLKASSAVPVLYRTALDIDGTRVVDGGVAAPIPAREAFKQGARRIIVVRSRPAGYRKRFGLENRLSAFATRKSPALSDAVLRQAETYCQCVDFLETPPTGTQILQIAPELPLKTGRTTQRLDALLADYELGKALGKGFVNAFRP
jgi:predicted patatin/cPLA2 family phospholipase